MWQMEKVGVSVKYGILTLSVMRCTIVLHAVMSSIRSPMKQ